MGGEEQISETTRAYEDVAERIGELRPETILISSPHATMYADYFHISPGRGAVGSFRAFGAPQVSFAEEYDTEFVETVEDLAGKAALPAGTEREREPELLEISVDVLTAPERVESEKDLDCRRYGVIVTNGRRRGLLLPDLEGVDSVEQQISIAKQKAGIGERESVSLQRFEVVRHT